MIKNDIHGLSHVFTDEMTRALQKLLLVVPEDKKDDL